MKEPLSGEKSLGRGIFLYLLVQAHQHSQVFMLRPSCDTVACALGKTWGIFKKPIENAVAQRGMASPMGFEPVF